MDVERLRELADDLETLPAVPPDWHDVKVSRTARWIDMRCWLQRGACGTVACIAGHAVALFDPDPDGWLDRGEIAARAAELLGICEHRNDYYRGPELTADEVRRAQVAKGIFHPQMSVVWSGKDCATVLRAVADAPPGTITCDEVGGMWEAVVVAS